MCMFMYSCILCCTLFKLLLSLFISFEYRRMVRGELKPFRFLLLWHQPGCEDKLIEVKGSGHLIWLGLSLILVRANAGAILMRSLSAFDDIILDL